MLEKIIITNYIQFIHYIIYIFVYFLDFSVGACYLFFPEMTTSPALIVDNNNITYYGIYYFILCLYDSYYNLLAFIIKYCLIYTGCTFRVHSDWINNIFNSNKFTIKIFFDMKTTKKVKCKKNKNEF